MISVSKQKLPVVADDNSKMARFRPGLKIMEALLWSDNGIY
jgi:hypothetical protein